jgi:hypothetical protein
MKPILFSIPLDPTFKLDVPFVFQAIPFCMICLRICWSLPIQQKTTQTKKRYGLAKIINNRFSVIRVCLPLFKFWKNSVFLAKYPTVRQTFLVCYPFLELYILHFDFLTQNYCNICVEPGQTF